MNVPLDRFVCHIQDKCPSNCTCHKQPSDLGFYVSCINTSLRHLPKELPDPNYPPPRVGRFELDFAANDMRVVVKRDYFRDAKKLFLNASRVHTVEDDAWRMLSAHVDYVDLSENRLTVLPKLLRLENLSFRWLALHNNPLRCDPEDAWVRDWLKSLGEGLHKPCHVFPAACGSPYWLGGKNILELSEADFYRNPERDGNNLIVEVSSSRLLLRVSQQTHTVSNIHMKIYINH